VKVRVVLGLLALETSTPPFKAPPHQGDICYVRLWSPVMSPVVV
jgi:hypothetical protein